MEYSIQDYITIAKRILQATSVEPLSMPQLVAALSLTTNCIRTMVTRLERGGYVSNVNTIGVINHDVPVVDAELRHLFMYPKKYADQLRCYGCGDIHTYIMKKVGDDYIYLDEQGREWKNKQCPDCLSAMELEKPIPSGRKCNQCGCDLPATNYFNCSWCIEHVLSDFNEDFILDGSADIGEIEGDRYRKKISEIDEWKKESDEPDEVFEEGVTLEKHLALSEKKSEAWKARYSSSMPSEASQKWILDQIYPKYTGTIDQRKHHYRFQEGLNLPRWKGNK